MIALVSLLVIAAAYDMSQWSTGRATHSGGEVTQSPCRVSFKGMGMASGYLPARLPDQSEDTYPQKLTQKVDELTSAPAAFAPLRPRRSVAVPE